MSRVKEIDIYNYRGIYEEQILPHVKEIMRICRQYRIPVFITIPVQNNEQETIYETELRTAGADGLLLARDEIKKIVMIQAGINGLASDNDKCIVL